MGHVMHVEPARRAAARKATCVPVAVEDRASHRLRPHLGPAPETRLAARAVQTPDQARVAQHPLHARRRDRAAALQRDANGDGKVDGGGGGGGGGGLGPASRAAAGRRRPRRRGSAGRALDSRIDAAPTGHQILERLGVDVDHDLMALRGAGADAVDRRARLGHREGGVRASLGGTRSSRSGIGVGPIVRRRPVRRAGRPVPGRRVGRGTDTAIGALRPGAPLDLVLAREQPLLRALQAASEVHRVLWRMNEAELDGAVAELAPRERAARSTLGIGGGLVLRQRVAARPVLLAEAHDVGGAAIERDDDEGAFGARCGDARERASRRARRSGPAFRGARRRWRRRRARGRADDGRAPGSRSATGWTARRLTGRLTGRTPTEPRAQVPRAAARNVSAGAEGAARRVPVRELVPRRRPRMRERWKRGAAARRLKGIGSCSLPSVPLRGCPRWNRGYISSVNGTGTRVSDLYMYTVIGTWRIPVEPSVPTVAAGSSALPLRALSLRALPLYTCRPVPRCNGRGRSLVHGAQCSASAFRRSPSAVRFALPGTHRPSPIRCPPSPPVARGPTPDGVSHRPPRRVRSPRSPPAPRAAAPRRAPGPRRASAPPAFPSGTPRRPRRAASRRSRRRS